MNEIGISEDNRVLVKVYRELFRPLEANNFIADYSKALKLLDWEPKRIFKSL